jgi:hypothetical protein
MFDPPTTEEHGDATLKFKSIDIGNDGECDERG